MAERQETDALHARQVSGARRSRHMLTRTHGPAYVMYNMYEPQDHEGVHVSVTEAREDFAELVNRAAYKEERVIITRRGRAIAAIVPIDDVAYLERLEDDYDLQEALRVLNDPDEMANTIPWEQVKNELRS